MDNNLVEIISVIDRSGSMESIQGDAQGGFNQMIKDQKTNIVGKKIKITLAQFDSEYELIWNGIDINSCGEYKLVPRGTTALLEAVTRTIDDVGKRLSESPEDKRPSRVIFIIVTDGHENASDRRIYSENLLKEKIKLQRDKYSWEFIFLGCSEDCLDVAESYGISKSLSGIYKATGAGTRTMYSNMSTIMACSINNNTCMAEIPDDMSEDISDKFYTNRSPNK